jgi:hypothetical protein
MGDRKEKDNSKVAQHVWSLGEQSNPDLTGYILLSCIERHPNFVESWAVHLFGQVLGGLRRIWC